MKGLFLVVLCLGMIGCSHRPSSKPQSVGNGTLDERQDTINPLKTDSTASISSSIPQTISVELSVKEELKGELIPADSFELTTRQKCYPLSVAEIKLFVRNRSEVEYEGGEEYSLARYDPSVGKWVPQPVNPICQDVLWIFSKNEDRIFCQTITLYTRNQAGTYRIRKLFNGKLAEATFEIADKKK